MTSHSSAVSTGARVEVDVHPLADLAPASAQFETRDGTVLLRGSISPSGTVYFPARELSLEGGSRDLQPCSFGPLGTLYSFSTIHVSSIRPTPYAIGYVDFDNGARVLAEVRGAQDDLACDIPVELRADNGDWFVVPVTTEGAQP